MFCSLLRCHLPELPLSDSGRGAATGNFRGFKYRLSYRNFSNANLIILGIFAEVIFCSPAWQGGYFLFRERLWNSGYSAESEPFFIPSKGKKRSSFLLIFFFFFMKKNIYIRSITKSTFSLLPPPLFTWGSAPGAREELAKKKKKSNKQKSTQDVKYGGIFTVS